MKLAFRLLPLAFFAPLFALAQGLGSNLGNYITSIMQFINTVLVPLVFALAFLAFLWGMFKTFILGGDNEEEQAKGKQLMMYSIAGFVVMVSLWGIVNFFANALNLGTNQEVNVIPNAPTGQR